MMIENKQINYEKKIIDLIKNPIFILGLIAGVKPYN